MIANLSCIDVAKEKITDGVELTQVGIRITCVGGFSKDGKI